MNLRLALAIGDRPAQEYMSKTVSHTHTHTKIEVGNYPHRAFHPRLGANSRPAENMGHKTQRGHGTCFPEASQDLILKDDIQGIFQDI